MREDFGKSFPTTLPWHASPEVPWPDLRYIFGEIMWHRETPNEKGWVGLFDTPENYLTGGGFQIQPRWSLGH